MPFSSTSGSVCLSSSAPGLSTQSSSPSSPCSIAAWTDRPIDRPTEAEIDAREPAVTKKHKRKGGGKARGGRGWQHTRRASDTCRGELPAAIFFFSSSPFGEAHGSTPGSPRRAGIGVATTIVKNFVDLARGVLARGERGTISRSLALGHQLQHRCRDSGDSNNKHQLQQQQQQQQQQQTPPKAVAPPAFEKACHSPEASSRWGRGRTSSAASCSAAACAATSAAGQTRHPPHRCRGRRGFASCCSYPWRQPGAEKGGSEGGRESREGKRWRILTVKTQTQQSV